MTADSSRILFCDEWLGDESHIRHTAQQPQQHSSRLQVKRPLGRQMRTRRDHTIDTALFRSNGCTHNASLERLSCASQLL